MKLWQSAHGRVQVRYTSADLAGAMAAMGRQGIGLWDLWPQDELTTVFWVDTGCVRPLWILAKRRGDQIEITKETGLLKRIRGIFKRPVLLFGLLGILIFSLWLPGRILFVQVEGNGDLPTRKILETAAQCGIYFGASRREVRSEVVKNRLLEAMEELSWAGVNTHGCTAVISVKERIRPTPQDTKGVVSSIVALRDGIVGSVTVTRGSGLCVPGQAVKAGQVLISGYTDCGLLIRATRAEGEIFGQTRRSVRVVCPTQTTKKGRPVEMKRNYSLILGKKRINFSNNSRILGSDYDKIYVENYWVLPGGFVLPVALAVETVIGYDRMEHSWSPDLTEAAHHYLMEQMRSGKILHMDQSITEREGLMILDADCSCYEMIGITRIEERLSDYGKNH